MALGKKIRFEVFKRDGFRCGYCGKTPPAVVLEVDHINPKSIDGTDDINNLLTACFDCNRGKRDIPLENVPASVKENLALLIEKEEQIEEYNKVLKRIRQREDETIEEVNSIFQKRFPSRMLTEDFKNNSVRHFVKSLDRDTVLDAMRLACSRIRAREGVTSYFCGICWKRIRGN